MTDLVVKQKFLPDESRLELRCAMDAGSRTGYKLVMIQATADGQNPKYVLNFNRPGMAEQTAISIFDSVRSPQEYFRTYREWRPICSD